MIPSPVSPSDECGETVEWICGARHSPACEVSPPRLCSVWEGRGRISRGNPTDVNVPSCVSVDDSFILIPYDYSAYLLRSCTLSFSLIISLSLFI